jgi:hypothetical protein
MPFPVRMIAGTAALLLGVLPAGAQNLLTNPGFATDLSGWSVGVTFVTATWQPLDATGQSNSGSASVTNTAQGLTNGLSQCVPATGGVPYDFGARIEVPPGQVIIKVLDACALGGHYWVFAGGLTNVDVVITVTDTSTGAVKTYTNPQGAAFQPIQDTAAFSTCP